MGDYDIDGKIDGRVPERYEEPFPSPLFLLLSSKKWESSPSDDRFFFDEEENLLPLSPDLVSEYIRRGASLTRTYALLSRSLITLELLPPLHSADNDNYEDDNDSNTVEVIYFFELERLL